ncbi:Fpg/Nei family DNA glycosylase [Kytococcus sedentarius]|uniref:Fpg/Nei family DNA glycosylase n=1 Tax=Kytococcus sedentarius TaxID=1276 RepID=UPI0035BC9738
MPEGDTVWRTARRLHLALAGRELTRTDLRWPSLATVDLTGRSTLEVVSRGKHLLHRIEGGLTLHSHLRMEGSWRVHPAPGPRRVPSTTRAVLACDEHVAVGTSLGMLDLVDTRAEDGLVGHLGPDLLGPDWDPDCVVTRYAQAGARPIGEALLDQRIAAGIGTMYAAEALFLRRISPWTTVGELPDEVLTRIVETARRAMTVNCARAVQRTTPDTLRETTWVHGRADRPCLRCGTAIRVDPIGVAPTDRVMFHCPACQAPGS